MVDETTESVEADASEKHDEEPVSADLSHPEDIAVKVQRASSPGPWTATVANVGNRAVATGETAQKAIDNAVKKL